ncbi:uncharacterized protein LOC144263186 isoform X2 [Eretmochelys imbricata]
MWVSNCYALCKEVLSPLPFFPSYINELRVMAPSSLPCGLLIKGICGCNYCKEIYLQVPESPAVQKSPAQREEDRAPTQDQIEYSKNLAKDSDLLAGEPSSSEYATNGLGLQRSGFNCWLVRDSLCNFRLWEMNCGRTST